MVKVSIVFGSESDRDTMGAARDVLELLGIPWEMQVLSAHRTPELMYSYARAAKGRVDAIIAGAGGAAHLPGMLAASTTVPVLGVPIESSALRGLDSLLSIVQMPAGVPVATFSIGRAGAANAALFAAALLAPHHHGIAAALDDYRLRQSGDRP